MANELLGSLFDNLGLCEGPEGCHCDWGQKIRNVTISKSDFCRFPGLGHAPQRAIKFRQLFDTTYMRVL